jgi:glycosyltransferase involved in cell wall biosynthesis
VIAPWLVELLRRLATAGCDVEVFTSAYRGGGGGSFEGIRVHRYRYFPRRWENLTHEETAPDRMRRSLLFRLMPIPFVLAGMLAIWRLCRRRRYDIVHVHWPVPLALFGRVAQVASGARMVMTFYGAELRLVRSFPILLKPFISWAT